MIKETLLASAFGLLGLVTVACGSQKKDLMAGTDYVIPLSGRVRIRRRPVLTMAWGRPSPVRPPLSVWYR